MREKADGPLPDDGRPPEDQSGKRRPYRRVTMRKGEPGDDWAAWMAAGWELRCFSCAAVLGRLFIPFSGGLILAGSSSRLDFRLVERSGRETTTGHEYRRYGPPTRVFAKGKMRRAEKAPGAELVVRGPFWIYCYVCNAGQAVEPDHAGLASV